MRSHRSSRSTLFGHRRVLRGTIALVLALGTTLAVPSQAQAAPVDPTSAVGGQLVRAAPFSGVLTADRGPAAGGTHVTMVGSGFVPGATTVTVGSTTIPAGSVTVSSPNLLDFRTPGGPPGPAPVVATTPEGSTQPLPFTYDPLSVPVLVTPANGTTVTSPVAFSGISFTPGTVTISIAGSPVCTTPTFASAFVCPAALPPGTYSASATVTDAIGNVSSPSFTNTFTVVVPTVAPTASSLSPDVGPAAGGTTVTVTGTGFVAGQTSVSIGSTAVSAGAVTVNSSTSLTFTTPASAAGAATVRVNTPGGASGPLTYTYVGSPTATSLTPSAGPTAGGQTVTVNGTGFVAGQTTVTTDGTVIPAAAVTVTSSTQLTYVTPAHAAGPVMVRVATPGGTSSPLVYAYVVPPTVTSLAPSAGPTAGGQTVTINGTGFVAGQTTVTTDGTVIPAAAVTVTSSTQLTYVTPAHAAGPVTVTASNSGGTRGALTYTYLDAPTAVSLTPSTGPTAGGQTVTITGTNLGPGPVFVAVDGIVLPQSAVIPLSATALAFVSPARTTGPVPVVITTLGGTAAPLTYTYVAAPTAASLTPASGPTAGGQRVTVAGTGFVTGQTTVAINDVPLSAGSITVTSPTSLTFTTPGSAARSVAVTVRTPGGTTRAQTYTYVGAPILTSLSPTSGPTYGGQTVTVTGTGFVAGQTTVTTDGTVVPAASVTVDSATQLSYVTPAHAAGPVDVTVTNPGGTSGARTYTYVDAPTAASLTSSAGPVAGGQTVTIDGTGFIAGQTTVTTDGTALPAASVTVTNPTRLSYVTPAHPAGPVTVTVTTAGGTSAPLTYTYVDAPTATSLTPSAGPVAGGQTVTVDGTRFVAGQTTVTTDGTAIPAASVTVTSPTRLTFSTPAHAAGPVDVTVTTPGGTTAPRTYTYVDAPTTTALSSTFGPTDGGQTVTVTGTGFGLGPVSVSIDGEPVPDESITVASPTTLTFVTPAHSAGGVEVVVTTPGGSTAPLTYTYVEAPTATDLAPGAGPLVGGTTVTITGTGFDQTFTTVTVDGEVVPATVESPTSLTFVTPAAGVAGAVEVVVANGTQAAAALSFAYDTPVIDLGATNVPGGTIPVTGECWPLDATVTVQLRDPDGEPVGDPADSAVGPDCRFSTSLPIPSGAAPGQYSVEATDDRGNSATEELKIVQPALEIADPVLGPDAPQQNTVTGTDWQPGVPVALEVRSDPVTLESQTPDADGRFASVFSTEGLSIGVHHVWATQVRSDGTTVTRSIAFEVVGPNGVTSPRGEDGPTGNSLPGTGSPVSPLLTGVGPLLVLLGAALVLTARARQRRA